MIRSIRFILILFLVDAVLPLRPQGPQSSQELLAHALHLADLYNWDDAGKDFADSERLFRAAGDQRNALYARLGKIRSTVDQLSLPATAAELSSELENNPLLQSDKELRLFCLIVKGDIDSEIGGAAMREDWERVTALARELDDKKWQYRALAELGIAAFYDGDLATAGKNVATALALATKNGDVAAQVRFLTTLGIGLREAHNYEEALAYCEKALKIASTIPDFGYPFLIKSTIVEDLIDLKRLDDAPEIVR
jgi:tetratricopeptide (TPR) repeat protein